MQKERLAYGAAAVVFDCGAASQVEYEMLFTLPDLALAVRKHALLSRFLQCSNDQFTKTGSGHA